MSKVFNFVLAWMDTNKVISCNENKKKELAEDIIINKGG